MIDHAQGGYSRGLSWCKYAYLHCTSFLVFWLGPFFPQLHPKKSIRGYILCRTTGIKDNGEQKWSITRNRTGNSFESLNEKHQFVSHIWLFPCRGRYKYKFLRATTSNIPSSVIKENRGSKLTIGQGGMLKVQHLVSVAKPSNSHSRADSAGYLQPSRIAYIEFFVKPEVDDDNAND